MKRILSIALLVLLIGLPGICAIGVGVWAPSHGLLILGSISLAVIVVLPLILAAIVRRIGRDRESLARYFPWLLPLAAYTLAGVLLFEGVLLWFTAAVADSADLPLGYLFFWLIFLGLGLLIAAYSVLRESHRLLAPQPLALTAVELQESDAPELWVRVRRLAGALRADPPKRMLIGLEPRAFVTMGPVALRPGSDALSGEALYLSAVLLHVLTDDELDALIGHELGHFRGQDLVYSQRFIPGFRSLYHVLSSIDVEEPRHNMNPLRGWITLGRVPASMLLLWLAARLALAKLRIDRERELAADSAATEVAPPRALLLAVVKIALLQPLWAECQKAIAKRDQGGEPRVDLVSFYRLFAQFYWTEEQRAADLQSRIAGVCVAHPTDTHPPLGERAATMGTNLDGVVGDSVAAFVNPQPAAPWAVELARKISQLHYELAASRSWVKDFIVERNSSEQSIRREE